MPTDNDSAIESLLIQLESTVDPARAALRVDWDDEGGVVYATRDGYLRLALALMRAAQHAESDTHGQRLATLDWTDAGAALPPFKLYVVDELPAPPEFVEARTAWGCAVGCLLMAAIGAALLGIGAATVVRWLM